MKYLKLFEGFEDIDAICQKYAITNYTINSDRSIDVNDGVDLSNKNLDKIPLKFNKVSGNFNCGNNQLISLEGSPKEVGSWFFCNDNKLITLEGGPEKVNSGFICTGNNLVNLIGSPKYVGGDFYCYGNKLISLEGAPKEIGGHSIIGDPVKRQIINYLPKLIWDNMDHINLIIKLQDDYSIWNKDNTFNVYRFEDMMEEIKEIKELKK